MKNERVESLVADLTWCSEGGEHAWVLWTKLETERIIVDCDTCSLVVYEGSVPINDLIIGPLPVTVERKWSEVQINPR